MQFKNIWTSGCWKVGHFKNLTPIPEIAELEWETWLIGQSLLGAELDLKAIIPIEETIEASEAVILIGKAETRLFSEKDIVAWGRPLRVAEDSPWTLSARRVRTLVMRLASQGRVGKNGISLDQIISGLPREYATHLEKLFPILIETGIFHQEAVDGGFTYCLNPERLIDVQDLI